MGAEIGHHIKKYTQISDQSLPLYDISDSLPYYYLERRYNRGDFIKHVTQTTDNFPVAHCYLSKSMIESSKENLDKNNKDSLPTENLAIRFITFKQDEFSESLINGYFNTQIDSSLGIYNNLSVGTCVTASQKCNSVEKKIPIGEKLMIVARLEKTDGRSFFLNADVYDENFVKLREYKTRWVKLPTIKSLKFVPVIKNLHE